MPAPDWTKVQGLIGNDWLRGGISSSSASGGHPVSNYDQYRQHALDCLRLASETNDPAGKAVLLDMAQSWVRLADQAQKNLSTDLVYETPPPPPSADDPPNPTGR
jgi:hypothetical protein